ncbi:MAG TPA: response regulator transcription factor [Saprospiraceae bacterium]|nr:response regulator transcription factor [Saprospiraceae bacterium]
MSKIFYVEDDLNLSFVVKDCLQMAGHEVHHFSKGDEALAAFNKIDYDLCVLDVMLPNIDGFTIAKAIRNKNMQIPIIFISARIQLEDKLEALNIGGDDYLFKPFSIEELLLKVGIFLKRKQIEQESNSKNTDIYHFGNCSYDCSNLILNAAGEEIRLTQREADLLTFFLKNQGKLLRREDILVALWGQDDYFLGRSLDVFISRIRKYLSVDKSVVIENIPRIGFKLVVGE